MVSIAEQRLTSNRIFHYLTYCSKQQFTGCLDIQAASGQAWQVYLNLGQLSWVAGGVHPYRRFMRQLQLAGLDDAVLQKVSQGSLPASKEPECIEYHLLVKLAQEKYLTSEQVMAVIKGILLEGLFDIVQASELASATLPELFSQQPEHKLTTVADLEGTRDSFYVQVKENHRPSQQARLPYTWMQPVTSMQQQVQQAWKRWLAMGLQNYSPNAAPMVKSQERLQAQTSEKVYKNLMSLMQGQETLRDLAIRLKRNFWAMTQVLQPLIHQQIIGFVEIRDRSLFSQNEGSTEHTSTKQGRHSSTEKKGLIACVDDSPQTQRMIEMIAHSLGYNFLRINESVEALPVLIEKKPDLIFLDLVMPVVNGYELCQQIRRVEALKKIPVVILTGNMVDRVRARLAGASECLTKPVALNQVRTLLHRHFLAEKALDE